MPPRDAAHMCAAYFFWFQIPSSFAVPAARMPASSRTSFVAAPRAACTAIYREPAHVYDRHGVARVAASFVLGQVRTRHCPMRTVT